MLLYFLRHGQAEEGGTDAERQLTAKGKDVLRAAIPLWRSLKVRPEAVISSPLPRAAQTAAICVEGLGLGLQPVLDERLEPGADWDDLAEAMAAHADARRVMFVGHEPDLSSAAVLLTGASSLRLRKGGMAAVEFPGPPVPGTGELVWLLDPDLYRAAQRPA